MSRPNSTLSRNGSQSNGQIFKLLADAIHEHLPEDAIGEEKVREIVAAEVAAARLPRPIEVRLPDGTHRTLESTHHQLEEILSLVGEGHQNVMMVGPAGSGKTTLAKNLAEALGREFGFISLSQGVTESHLMGRILPQEDGSWQYQPTRFIEIFEGGGVFLLDEIDAADSNLMVSINAALANGVLANPNGQIHKRHPETVIIAAANTWGRGADASYVGRNALDASTLDRFVMSTAFVDYDPQLEEQICSGLSKSRKDELLGWIRDLRTAISRSKLRRIASTRLVVGSAAALRAGKTLDQVKARYFRSWTADEVAKVSSSQKTRKENRHENVLREVESRGSLQAVRHRDRQGNPRMVVAESGLAMHWLQREWRDRAPRPAGRPAKAAIGAKASGPQGASRAARRRPLRRGVRADGRCTGHGHGARTRSRQERRRPRQPGSETPANRVAGIPQYRGA
ncbi:MAG: AAA family ATPase, partial [Planctomycetota bacterium]